MSELDKTVTVTLLGKAFQIKCPEDQVVDLQRSAAFLDTKMSALQKNGQLIGTERVAVIAALNLANELLSLQQQNQQEQLLLTERINTLLNKVNEKLPKVSA